jgi:hypothetical protein
MKKTSKKPRAPRTNQCRTLDEPALAIASGGATGDPAVPWTPEQHNEAFTARPRRRRAVAESALPPRAERCR